MDAARLDSHIRGLTVIETKDEAALSGAVIKVRNRVIPFLVLCYLVAYLDRVNVGFAALTMNADLQISAEAFGFTAGIFFLGYAIFEVPSNIALERFGARRWIARIMISWGVISIGMAFVTDALTLGIARFLLGVAEAGFFPGIIYYLTRWVPASERASIISFFMMAVPVSLVVGAPISGLLLDSTHLMLGLKGWQWLFVIEAIPAVLLGFVVFFFLQDRIEDADWLTSAERRALRAAIDAESIKIANERPLTTSQTLVHPQIYMLSVIYFGIAAGLYGLTFWLPQIVKGFGYSNTVTGFVTAVPYLIGAVAMALWGLNSDRTGERIWHIATACFVGGAGLIVAAVAPTPTIAFAGLSLAAVGIFSALPTFWTLPSAMLTGAAAAVGIALINAIGNVGGFLGPYVVGALKERGVATEVAVSSLAVVIVLSGFLVIALARRSS